MSIQTEEMMLNMGPQHPSTHGVIRFVVKSDGEVMSEAIPDVGYLHRSIEKIGEICDYNGFMPYTDRADYLSAMNANLGYALVVEKLLGTVIPKRADYLRVISSEFNRIISHLLAIGTLAMDVGAATPFIHTLKEREKVNDLMEALCGQRLTYNYVRIGGVGYDMPPGFSEQCLAFLDQFDPQVDEFERLVNDNKIFIERLANVGIVTRQDAIAFNLTGPNLRGSGVDFDLRRDMPYSVYPELEFDVPLGHGEVGTLGDCFDRFVCRVREIKQSIRILRQCFAKIPEGPIMGKISATIKPPAGEAYVRTESSRGDMGYYLISDGSKNAFRVRIRTGSFTAMAIIEKISRGMMIADLVTFIASLDVVAPEIDR
jgi:NADH-quinone oxidoreductase subunit D